MPKAKSYETPSSLTEPEAVEMTSPRASSDETLSNEDTFHPVTDAVVSQVRFRRIAPPAYEL